MPFSQSEREKLKDLPNKDCIPNTYVTIIHIYWMLHVSHVCICMWYVQKYNVYVIFIVCNCPYLLPRSPRQGILEVPLSRTDWHHLCLCLQSSHDRGRGKCETYTFITHPTCAPIVIVSMYSQTPSNCCARSLIQRTMYVILPALSTCY